MNESRTYHQIHVHQGFTQLSLKTFHKYMYQSHHLNIYACINQNILLMPLYHPELNFNGS